jgi:hypothetical protein
MAQTKNSDIRLRLAIRRSTNPHETSTNTFFRPIGVISWIALSESRNQEGTSQRVEVQFASLSFWERAGVRA